MSADESKTALIVIGNPITEGQLQMVLRKRGWTAEIVKDGDKAVDEFVSLRPDLIFIAVDIPTLDGHVAALEMRESDPKARIVFVSSRGRMNLAEDAAYSAGAVGVLMTPFTDSSVEEVWQQWMGRIPEAPGLTDLDALYPTLEDPEPEPPLLPPLPPLPSGMSVPLPDDVELPSAMPTNPVPPSPPTKRKSKGRWIVRLVLFFIIAGGAVGGAHYAGLLDLNALIDQIPI
ncbi:MAG: response regulator [Candidatus Thermoplasmatota archaeon]|nr:response regulator [Candidatus Thermoplasmatota archaeon]